MDRVSRRRRGDSGGGLARAEALHLPRQRPVVQGRRRWVSAPARSSSAGLDPPPRDHSGVGRRLRRSRERVRPRVFARGGDTSRQSRVPLAELARGLPRGGGFRGRRLRDFGAGAGGVGSRRRGVGRAGRRGGSRSGWRRRAFPGARARAERARERADGDPARFQGGGDAVPGRRRRRAHRASAPTGEDWKKANEKSEEVRRGGRRVRPDGARAFRARALRRGVARARSGAGTRGSC